MKKIFTLLFLGLGSFVASAQTIFSQDFSQSTTYTDYFTTGGTVNAVVTSSKFTSVATAGTPTNSITNGRLQLGRTVAADGTAIQLDGLSATGTECVAVSFDFRLESAGTSGTAFQIFLGDGTTAGGTSGTATAAIFGRLSVYFDATPSTYGFDYLNASGTGTTYTGGSARALATTYKVTCVVNGSLSPVSYTSQNGTPYIVAAQTYDILIDGIRTSSVASLTGGKNTFKDLRIRHISGSYIPTSTIAFDNFKVQTLINGGTLPVSFSSLSANLSGSNVNVNWSTASEANNDHFEIEASTDGKTFKTIKTVATQNGNSSTVQNYSESVSIGDIAGLLAIPVLLGFVGFAPLSRRRKFVTLAMLGFVAATGFVACQKEGKGLLSQQGQNNADILSGNKSVYIRIKQVDKNGTFTYSNIVVAK